MNSCLIPIEKLINLRKRSALAYAKKSGHVHEKYPEQFLFFPALYDSTDSAFHYQAEIRNLSWESGIVCQDETHTEFASRSLISPEKVSILQKLAESARAKRISRENYNRRVKESGVKRVNASSRLGNIGNNLDNVPKPVREKRYRIQRFIQAEGLSKSSAVCNCGTSIGEFVHLKKNMEFGNVNVSGVATCGSVWACPVCRAKIVNERSKELFYIYTEGKKRNWKFTHITFTFSHSRNDNLAELYGSSSLRKGMSGAYTKFRQSRVWSKEFKPAVDFVGDVRAVEITWGNDSGYHPHIHMVVMHKKDLDVDHWQEKIFNAWHRACKSSGIGLPSREHGIMIEPVKDPNQVTYLAKWSVASEIQSDQAKSGRYHNYSIADLESMLIDSSLRDASGMKLNRIAGILASYYRAMHGQKQLVYGGLNTGWKKEIELDEPDDQELTSEEYQAREESIICIMNADLYRVARKNNIIQDVINQVEGIPWGPDYSVKVINVLKKCLSDKKIPFRNKIYTRKLFDKKFHN